MKNKKGKTAKTFVVISVVWILMVYAMASGIYFDEGIFIALGYGFNLYDLNIAKKASLEGCERMRVANKIKQSCKCEMILYNDEILINNKNE